MYRLGSLGDTVVALPSLHLVARAFPNADRRLLTNFPINGKAAPLESVLGDSGLIHGYFRYPIGSRNLWELARLSREIRAWSPDVLVYLAAPRGRFIAYRDAMFFFCSGISHMIGVPYRKTLQEVRKLSETRFEPEAHRLARGISALGKSDLEDPKNWDLRLTEHENDAATRLLWPEQTPYFAISVGTKVDTKDWGESNWTRLLAKMTACYPGIALVLLGARDEFALSERVSQGWNGPTLNLCGLTVPRVSAALLKRALLFVGHDSGPMHLAAAVGTRCVAIFSARNRPGEWFPYGRQHTIIYHQTECFGCELAFCHEHRKKCIMSIKVDEVLSAIIPQMERLGVGEQFGVV